ncbi:MAG: peptidylprolyl isomerase, partial [Paracoccaceae bacterium]
MRLSTLTLALVTALAFGAPTAGPARAQGEFAPVLTVNGLAITGYELDQRIRFLKLLGATGDLPALAETALIEDRLRKSIAKSAGIEVSEAQLRGGLEEFAGRANLSVEQFIEAIAQGGVDPETFRDFVEAGLLWREIVRQKYRGVINVTGPDVDRALSVTAKRGAGPRVLLSEIVIPVRGGNDFVAQKAAVDLAKALSEGASFAESARALSAAPSREAGGQVGWMPLTNLPVGARAAVAALSVGQTSDPVEVPGGFAVFQLRGIDQGGPEVPAGSVTLDYLSLAVPSAADAAQAASSVATCDDLYSFARANPGTRLAHAETRAGAGPGGIAP